MRVARPTIAVGWAFCLTLTISGCQTPRAHYAGPLIQTPANCTDIRFPIYFESGSAQVTREAERLVADAHDRARGCQVAGIVVVGLADAPGAPDANFDLSARRANAVTGALRRHGFTDAEFRESAGGAEGASTASGAEHPLRRRADVSIHLASPAAH